MVNFKFARKILSAGIIATGALAAVAIPQASWASSTIYVQYGSPASYFEPAPYARRGYIWVPGYWDWRGHRRVWIDGSWSRDRHVHHYRPHRWDGRWYQERNRWDRDRDGIPDYRDSRPYNPRRW